MRGRFIALRRRVQAPAPEPAIKVDAESAEKACVAAAGLFLRSPQLSRLQRWVFKQALLFEKQCVLFFISIFAARANAKAN